MKKIIVLIAVLLAYTSPASAQSCVPPRSDEDRARYFECSSNQYLQEQKARRKAEEQERSSLEVSQLRLEIQRLKYQLATCGK